ncbi:hypothetical protein QUF76_08540 [Desulfobacterales bacterium HSG16]|nr:hypothetical protein [Desulfobacterales bacterium HSG16]
MKRETDPVCFCCMVDTEFGDDKPVFEWGPGFSKVYLMLKFMMITSSNLMSID